MSDGIKVGPEPLVIGAQWPRPELVILEVLQLMGVYNQVRADPRFRGLEGLPGWSPQITIVPSMPGQHDVVCAFIDMTVKCSKSAEHAVWSEQHKCYWQNWTGSAGFLRRDPASMHPDKFAELVRLRVTNAIGRMRPVPLGACDNVQIGDEDMLPEDRLFTEAVGKERLESLFLKPPADDDVLPDVLVG